MPSASSAPTLPFLERLLDGEKVEWKTLGEVCDTVKATSKLKSADYCVSGKVPIIDQGAQYIAGYTDKELATIPKDEYIIFGDHTETIKFVDFEFVQGADGLKILHTKKALSKYVYYAFSNFYKKTASYKRHWSKAKETSIPIPPLRVQSRIVEILDKFTQLEAQLEAELQAELEARNKQYDFYRNRLLDFALRDDLKGQVEWKTLGEVCVHLRTGLNPRRNFRLNTEDASNYYVTVRELGGTELLYSEKTDLINDDALQLINNRSKLKVNDILFSGTGTIGKTAFISKEPTNWNIKEGVYALTLDTHYVLPMFVLRYLQTQSTIDWIDRMAAGGIVRSITMKNLEQLPIPLPPLSEQRRIVDILDRFDTLTNSISEGLPREIALRRKQYEYYRDALLRFPHPAPTA